MLATSLTSLLRISVGRADLNVLEDFLLPEKESFMQKQRRDFLKLTTAGATGLVLAGSRDAHAAWPSSGKLEINPDISNMRVVACVDKAMMKSTPTNMTFDTQNAAVDYPRVQANMDAMAMTLSQKDTPDEAWKNIFRTSKDWADTLVAIKVNAGESKNTARLAVLQKFSNTLVGFGVQPKNIIVYDGHSTADGIFTSSFSLTDKNKVLGVVSRMSDALGGTKDAKLPDGSSKKCTAKIADGTVDILIVIANNKGHTAMGGVTLCMKNHFGTFEPDHTDLNNYILELNKSDAIIGGTPARQQLCFVDSMFVNKASVFGTPELMPCYFVMGTFAPAVDYLTVKKIREEVCNLTHTASEVKAYVTSFGYTTEDPKWILVPPAGATSDAGAGGAPGDAGSGRDGSSGTGGVGGGGTKGSDGGGAGGTKGSGGMTSGGGTKGPGGAKGTGGVGPGGTNGSGGVASGGEKGSGGMGSGGATGKGGSGGNTNSGGVGGTSTKTASGTGGSTSTGSSTGEITKDSNSGCGCRVGASGGKATGLGMTLGLGAIIAGQLRRLFLRRENLTQADHPEDEAKPSPVAQADHDSGK
jgi:hypothetical protein